MKNLATEFGDSNLANPSVLVRGPVHFGPEFRTFPIQLILLAEMILCAVRTHYRTLTMVENLKVQAYYSVFVVDF